MLEMFRMLQPARPTIWRANACVGSKVPMKFRLNTISTPLSSRSKKVTVSLSRSAISKYSLSVLARALLPPAPFTRISQGAKVCQYILGHLQTVGLVHHVAGVSLGNAALGLDLIFQLLELIHVAAQQRHLCTRPCQRLGKNGAQRAACAGDNGHLAGKIGVQYIFFNNILLLQLYSLARV